MRCDVLIGIDCEYYCFVIYNVVWSGILLPAFDSILLLHLWWRQHILMKDWWQATRLHGIIPEAIFL